MSASARAALATGGSTTEQAELRVIADRLGAFLRAEQWETLPEEQIESLKYIRRLCTRAVGVALRGHRDAAGVDAADTAASYASNLRAIQQALGHVPAWRGTFNGRFMAQHHVDGGLVTVAADTLEQTLALVDGVRVAS